MALQAELETHLSQDLERNRKNGISSKTMKSANGTFDLETPRDRNGSFESELIKKNQTHMSDELESKMLSLLLLEIATLKSQIILKICMVSSSQSLP